MPGSNLPKLVDATYIADRLALEAEMFRGLIRSGCLTPADASKLTEEFGRFCLEAAEAVKAEASHDRASERSMIRSRCDEGFGRLPAEALFWD